MLLFGHPWVSSPRFVRVEKIEDLKQTVPSDIVVLDLLQDSHPLAAYAKEQNIVYGVFVESSYDAIIAQNLNATYAIATLDTAVEIQSLATEYLWTMRILVPIDEDSDIEKWAKQGIDGVVFKSAII